MPLAMFWSANKQIDRLKAESDRRQLKLVLAGAAPEGARDLDAALMEEMGSPSVVVRGFDEAKFLEMQKKLNSKG